MADGETKGKYEQFWGFQEAVNKAIAENRPVRFICNMSNEEIRKALKGVDKKGCKFHKPDSTSKDVAVIPPGIEDFDFNAVDTKIELINKSNILLPGRDF